MLVKQSKILLIDTAADWYTDWLKTANRDPASLSAWILFLGTVLSSQVWCQHTFACQAWAAGAFNADADHSVFLMAFNYFCQSFIESLLTFSFICWFGGPSVRNRKSLNGVVKLCSKITGVQQKDLCFLWEEWAIKKAKGAPAQLNPFLFSELIPMSSWRPLCSSEGFVSFIPACGLINVIDSDSEKWLINQGVLTLVSILCVIKFDVWNISKYP